MINTALSIQSRLVLYVGISLAALTALIGTWVYIESFQHEQSDADAIERQLVRTLQIQAEIAAFTGNEKIAADVIDGLTVSPRILGARISGRGGKHFDASANFSGVRELGTVFAYPLFSPVDGKEKVGFLEVVRNEKMIRAEATVVAMQQTGIAIAQILITTILIMLFSRRLIGTPVSKLASDLAQIRVGDNKRLRIEARHEKDEIGSLTAHINALIDAAETALEQAQSLAVTDELTGLPNRRAFMTRLDAELERVRRYAAAPVSVLMLDLDHFKRINDEHGHEAGDQVLREFGAMLVAQLRKVDLAGRIGGEEFGIVLPDTDVQAAKVFAERLRESVANARRNHAQSHLTYTISIGIASIKGKDARHEDALARADRALYQAKQRGRNRVEIDGNTIEEKEQEFHRNSQ